jgi:NAD+ kinase
MKIGVMANPSKAGAAGTARRLIDLATAHGIAVLLERATAELLGSADGVDARELSRRVDLVAVLGGDGTMLHALSCMDASGVPMAGVNIGTLGFLTSCTDGELEGFVAALARGSFTTVPRALLAVRVETADGEVREFTALNEVTLTRGQTGRLVSLTASVNGGLLNHYRADGLIVATPTGSTAYSLSAGGPLVSPDAEVFVITPICPHSLSNRSLVVADSAEIELTPNGGSSEPMLFTVDGRDCLAIEDSARILIRKAPGVLPLVRLEGHSFYETLRQKLHWHGG